MASHLGFPFAQTSVGTSAPERDVEEYRALVHASRHVRPRRTFDKGWGGPVSVHADGSVLALPLLPGQDEEPSTVAVRVTSPMPDGSWSSQF
ncbi:hypothetical protein [Streptomyces sp. NPDC026589]|uniref:hypothetical protein n=1 Tax=Streptomyces sp. NPDC026589 TaxID=3155609 RepID=UPI0033FB9776